MRDLALSEESMRDLAEAEATMRELNLHTRAKSSKSSILITRHGRLTDYFLQHDLSELVKKANSVPAVQARTPETGGLLLWGKMGRGRKHKRLDSTAPCDLQPLTTCGL